MSNSYNEMEEEAGRDHTGLKKFQYKSDGKFHENFGVFFFRWITENTG